MSVVIGVTGYREHADWGTWHGVPAVLVPAAYVDVLVRVGGTPVVIPPRSPLALDEAERLISALDGLLVTGGVDVDPARYARDRHPMVQESRADRDETELMLVGLARERDLPVLGVCRGMQVMAVEAGGALFQHIPDHLGHEEHAPGDGVYGSHPVSTVRGSRVAAILGERVDSVPSYHHQAVVSCPGYQVTATAPDGTAEAMEAPDARFRLGVQWHPETGTDDRLFSALVAAASQPR